MGFVETPILGWNVDPDLDRNEAKMVAKFTGYCQDQKHWSDCDKRAIRDKEVKHQVEKAFCRSPASFNLYFWQSTYPDYDRTMQKGMVNKGWMRKILGSDVTDRILTTHSADAITVVFTNNLSDEHKISLKSPWMVAHRIAHNIMGGKTTPAGYDARSVFKEFLREVLVVGYGLEWPDEDSRYGMAIATDYREIYGKMMGHFLGTMKSARMGKLVQASEWAYESFAQYIITGSVPINPLPEYFDEGLMLTTDPRKRKAAMALWRRFPHRVDRVFRKMLQKAKGRIFVG